MLCLLTYVSYYIKLNEGKGSILLMITFGQLQILSTRQLLMIKSMIIFTANQ